MEPDDQRTINIDLLDHPIGPKPSNARKRVEDWWNYEVNRIIVYPDIHEGEDDGTDHDTP